MEMNEANLQPHEMPGMLSLVIPIYNEEEVLPFLKARLEALTKKLPCRSECIFVNDGSTDLSSRFLADWAAKVSSVRVIELARNFGHQAAVTAGMDHISGDVVVIMDADLQDPPELIFKMLDRYLEGYDIVYAQRIKRHGETLFKRFSAAAFYWIMHRLVHRDLPMNAGDFRLMSRDAAAALGHLREGQRFLRGMISWLGFYQIAVPFERPARAAGTTKYPLRKMLRFAWDAILSFSSAPLLIGTYLGALVLLFGMGMGAYSVIRNFLFHDLVPGWPTLVVLQCVIGGATLVCIGMIGEYVGRIYDELKYRPIYIVRRALNIRVGARPARAVTRGEPGTLHEVKAMENKSDVG